MWAILARKHLGKRRKVVDTLPDVTIESRGCTGHEGITGKEVANECVNLAAMEHYSRAVEWLRLAYRIGEHPMA